MGMLGMRVAHVSEVVHCVQLVAEGLLGIPGGAGQDVDLLDHEAHRSLLTLQGLRMSQMSVDRADFAHGRYQEKVQAQGAICVVVDVVAEILAELSRCIRRRP